MRLTEKKEKYIKELKTNGHIYFANDILPSGCKITSRSIEKLGQLEDIEEELGIDLVTFLKGIDPDTCFMEITKDKKFYLCGDAYCGDYSKEALLKLIQELLFMYWALTKEELL